MESPVRKLLKRNDYNRHKLLRKIKRRRKAAAEQQAHAAEKALKKKLRVTPPKFEGGKNAISIKLNYDMNSDTINPHVTNARMYYGRDYTTPLSLLLPTGDAILDVGKVGEAVMHIIGPSGKKLGRIGTEVTLKGNKGSKVVKFDDFGRTYIAPSKPAGNAKWNTLSGKVWLGNLNKTASNNPNVSKLQYVSYEPVESNGFRNGDIVTTYLEDLNLTNSELADIFRTIPSGIEANAKLMEQHVANWLHKHSKFNNVRYFQDFDKGKNITLTRFEGGKNTKDIDITYVDNPTYNEELGLFKDDNGRVVGDSIVLPELEVTPQLSRANEFRDQRKRFHYEQPLETVSPEFEALALGRGLWNDMFSSTIKRPINITTDNAKNATDEMWDNAYFYALKKNDKEELQRLRDLHFKTKATSPILDESGNPLTTYHTVGDKYDPSFNTFDQSIEGQHTGIFTTDNPVMSASYTNQIVSKKELDGIIEAIRLRELKKVSGRADDDPYKKWAIDKYSDKKKAKKLILKDHPFLKNIDPRQRQKELYLNLENPVVIDGEGTWWNNMPLEKAPLDLRIYPIVDRRTNNGPVMSTRSIDRVLGGYPETMPRTKYDSAIFKNIDDYGGSKYVSNEFNKPGTVFDVQNSSALKYSNAITYDDFGKVIPLSKRDNFNINDLRYGLAIPFTAITGYSMLNSLNTMK